MSSTKRKLPTKLLAPQVKQSARTPSKQILSEAQAVVGHGSLDSPSLQPNGHTPTTETIDVSSDAASDSEDLDDADLSEHDEDAANFRAPGSDVAMGDADEDGAPEPTFGDLVLAHTSEPIAVSAAFAASTAPKSSALALGQSTGASLGVALSQALKTSDAALLESCLQTSDLATIRATIQRLAPPLASTLLSLLAARLHRRPGRAGSLIVWIQWTLVTHGGYIATQPVLVAKLAALERVIEERARGLQGLLMLKGKLDLLDAQMQLRRSMREGRGRGEESDEEDGVVYVEGEESEEEVEERVRVNGVQKGRAQRFEDSESEMSDEMPDTLGERIIADSDEEDEEEDSDEEGLVDDEAEETDDDSGDDEEAEVDFEDADEEEEDSEAEAVTGRTPKMQKVGGIFGRRN